MNLVWLDLNCSYAHASLALPALHAQCRETPGIQWECVRATTNMHPAETVNNLYRARPDVIAATAWLFNIESLKHILCRIKTLCPECIIILGGPEFLDDNETFLRKNTFIDCVFRGEGETGFARWLASWNKPEKWEEITGLCWLDTDNRYRDNGHAKIKDFSALAPPENSRFFNWEKPFVQLETARGCFNTCYFCVSGQEKPVRTLPVETIRKRLATIRQHGIREVRLLDRTFNYNDRRATELLNLFSEFPNMKFHLEIHPGLLSTELKKTLTRLPVGLLHLEAGIQSLKEKTLRASGRLGELYSSTQGLRFLCTQDNFQTHADLIAGLPFYTLEELIQDTLALAGMEAGEIQLELLKVLPGTVMREKAGEWGLCYSPYPPYEILQTPAISPAGLKTARHISRLLDLYYNTPEWQSLTRALMLQTSGFIPRFLKFLEKKNVLEQPLALDRRGILLYEYLKEEEPDWLTSLRIAWIAAGLSHKKEPATGLRTKGYTVPEHWDKIARGQYDTHLQMAVLPAGDIACWFGFETGNQQRKPVFVAVCRTNRNSGHTLPPIYI